MAGTMPEAKALEYRAEVDSLEALQAERRTLLPRYSALAAKFKGGNSASGDTKRKQHRALVMKRIAMELELDDKFAENKLERMANSDVEHIAYCESLEREFTEYVLLDFKITEIKEKIESRTVELYCYNGEMRMQS